jgi:hypothetical protein
MMILFSLTVAQIRLRLGEWDFSSESEPNPYMEQKAVKKVLCSPALSFPVYLTLFCVSLSVCLSLYISLCLYLSSCACAYGGRTWCTDLLYLHNAYVSYLVLSFRLCIFQPAATYTVKKS